MKKLILLIAILVSCNPSYSDSIWVKEKNLNDIQARNLLALSKLYGCARYFYPNMLTSEWTDLDWYKYLAIASERIMNVEDKEVLKKELLNLYSPIIPELTFELDSLPIIDHKNSIRKMGNVPFYVWKHYGFGKRPIDNIFESKIELIDTLTDELPIPDSLYRIELTPDIYVYYPIAVSYKHQKTASFKKLKKQISQKKLRLLDISEANYILKDILNIPIKNKEIAFIRDPHIRFADIMVKWNIINHFYPYFDEDNLTNKWDDVLITGLNEAASCNNQAEYYNVVRRLFSNVNDSHITVHRYGVLSKLLGLQLPYFVSDIKLGWIGNKIYLDENLPDTLNTSIRRGDVISFINGLPIDSVIYQKLQLISASTIPAKYESLTGGVLLESFKYADTLHVGFTNKNKEVITIPVVAKSNPYSISEKEPNTNFISESAGIYYINLTKRDSTASYQHFRKKLDQIKKAKGIILDIRGYPDYTVADSIIVHFKKDSLEWGDFRRPERYFPFQQHVIYKKDISYLPSAKEDLSDIPVCILINHKAVSYAETLITLIKKNKIGTLIGQPTNGTNGDVTMIHNPIYGFTMTVIKDFSGLHGKGIMPDINVQPTLDGIIANKDEILETAKKYICELDSVN